MSSTPKSAGCRQAPVAAGGNRTRSALTHIIARLTAGDTHIMSQIILTREQIRQVDQRAINQVGMSGLVLMENAGRGVADTLSQLGVTGPVAICCGKGNNAGDGFVIARHLENRRISVDVYLTSPSDELSGDARTNFQILKHTSATVHGPESDPSWQSCREKQLGRAEWIVDALLGTGARGNPRPPMDTWVRLMNAAPAAKMAIDVPSGLDCDTGRASADTFRADHTCTFVAVKPGLLHPEARPFVGVLHVVDIGVPRSVCDAVRGDE